MSGKNRINYVKEIADYVIGRRSGVSVTKHHSDDGSLYKTYTIREIEGALDDGRILNVRTKTPVFLGDGRRLEIKMTPTRREHIGYRIEIEGACKFFILSGLTQGGVEMACDTYTDPGASEEVEAVLKYVHGVLTTPGNLKREKPKVKAAGAR